MPTQFDFPTNLQHRGHSPDCAPGVRNNYYDGKRLSVDSFRIEQNYSLARRRLLNRAIHGWGVVYGFQLELDRANEPPQDSLPIRSGLALDSCGRELLNTGNAVPASDLLILDDKWHVVNDSKGKRVQPTLLYDLKSPQPTGDWWLLSAHYAEKSIAPIQIHHSCRCDQHAWDRTCETVCFSLHQLTADDDPKKQNDVLNCDCPTTHRAEPLPSAKDAPQPPPLKRGGDCCLADYLAKLADTIQPKDPCECLYPVEDPCRRLSVDLNNGVPLACLKIFRDDKSNRWTVTDFDPCCHRRLVKRNDLLFDLIRGCDLTRIVEIGWASWHRGKEIPFDDFRMHALDRLWVKFSRPVSAATLHRDCFAMTVLSREQRTSWWQPFRAPIVHVDKTPTANYPRQDGDPEDHVRGAKLILDPRWVEDEIHSSSSLFLGKDETTVEIEIRGDFILDCNGQAVDANAIGRNPMPTGNGTPGGTFLSSFRVTPHHGQKPQQSP